MSKLSEDMEREIQAVRRQVIAQETARDKAQRTCCVCFDDNTQGLQCEEHNHFVCLDCAPQVVERMLDQINEDPAVLERHRSNWGNFKCVQPDCNTLYAETQLARHLPEAIFCRYCAAQNAVIEQSLFEQLQGNFQQRLAAARAEFECSNLGARQAQDTSATEEYMRRQFPNAVQCPICGAGPVIPENCYDLQAHHGERLLRGGHVSNACPSCGFFSRDRGEWKHWDGRMR